MVWQLITILLTSFFTVIGGVIVFVVGQIVQRVVIEPVQEFRRAIGEVVHATTFYANVSDGAENEGYRVADTAENASRHLRRLSGQIRGQLYTIPFFDTLAERRIVPVTRETASMVSDELIGWSNAVYGRDADLRQQRIANIKQLLNLKP